MRGRLEQRDFACRALPRLHLLRRGNALHRAEIMRLKTEDSTEPLLPAEAKATYQSEVQPWVAPFDYAIGAVRSDGQRSETHFALVVK